MNGVLLRPSRVEYKGEPEDAYNSRSTIHVCMAIYSTGDTNSNSFWVASRLAMAIAVLGVFTASRRQNFVAIVRSNHRKQRIASDIAQVAVMPLHGDMINGCHV